jgi:hypothetical protein
MSKAIAAAATLAPAVMYFAHATTFVFATDKAAAEKADADAPVKAKKVAKKKAKAPNKAAKADSKPAKKVKPAKAKTAKKKFKPFVPET